MVLEKMLKIVETHTGGNPTRHVVGGAPRIIGNTMLEKMTYMRENFDWIRNLSMMEPRGHSCMSGTLYTEPCNPDADMGILYFDSCNYMTMCGHSTIAVATVLVETGMVQKTGEVTTVKLDTPAGLVTAYVKCSDAGVESVSFRNVDSFLYASEDIFIDKYGDIPVHVSYGGNAFVIVEADKLGLGGKIEPGYSESLYKAGIAVHAAAEKSIGFIHPEDSDIAGIMGVMIHENCTDDGVNSHEAVICIPSEEGNAVSIDRSPCGTGTSARVAMEYALGNITKDEAFVQKSICGSCFTGRVVSEGHVGRFNSIIPEITGSAYITANIDLIVDSRDPIKRGFII